MKLKLIALISLLLPACAMESHEESKETNKEIIMDQHSYAKPAESVVTHLKWNAVVDFENKKIDGVATLHLKNGDDAKEVVLDTKALKIEKVLVGKKEAKFTLGEADKNMGSALTIPIKSSTDSVTIHYSTSTDAEALQWLTPMQTAGKKHPFLFTQSQAILARSWVPIQDSPGIRFTYEADVKVPSELLALMSAENPQEKNTKGEYHFVMDKPIPAYLLALSVGDLEFEPIGDRSGVYAEPSVIDAAAFEFEDLEEMISAAESLYGPYQWGRYDLLVLPPSFPFGGMENPKLTFATPTILAGDKSLTSLVAHELAHSWSGNLVTNATWNDFWLNEGFTVYFENRIMEKMYGRDFSEMEASLAYQGLVAEIADMKNNGSGDDTRLKLDLSNRNPDDGVTSIAYDKGYLFLRSQEEKVGREKFDIFLKDYFTSNAFSVMTTENFIRQLDEKLYKKNGLEMDTAKIKEWIYQPGLPADAPKPTSDKFAKVDEQMSRFLTETKASDLEVEGWSSQEWLHFVRSIPANLTKDQMKALDDAFGFTKSGNSEVLTEWLVQSIRHNYEASFDELIHFLVNTGRRKFLMPLYQEMVNSECCASMATSIYTTARPNYHFVSTNSLDELLDYSK
ncbi:M1 family metallopeptidase [Fulvivirga lutimaris]|uniref:M1 family metallopeptidase n=1 Tax=Fulvivirga lutimaris TaxID=1819566 RepID=UPI0012BC1783|nr:M1 family metallopeptidase [Fulvivirga lutimaris]MTI41620.1 M1 family peptidase [Fulvivirga lutimaris]